MPHFQSLNSLESLRDRLRSELDIHHSVHSIGWGNPRAMTEALKSVKRDLSGQENENPAEDQLNVALMRFSKSSVASSFNELKYVCYGATVPVGREQWRLIDRRSLFDALLAQVKDQFGKPKQFRRCYQGLLSAYFGFERNLAAPSEADTRWLSLRAYLSEQLEPLRRASLQRGSVPDWLSTLSEHRNLLSSDPCSRYADGLTRDDQTELKQVCIGLGISSNSWVWDEALMAYVKLVCQSDDLVFKQRMSAVLNLVNGKTTLALPVVLATKSTAQLVTRYAQCSEHPEHAMLRDTCVEWIGNPWLKRTAWDAVVNHEPARLMVNSWLKQRLIKDFFQLLAADGAADLRRLNYWLKWESQIADMWFVLGGHAADNKSPEFKELRKRMAGRDRLLGDANHLNNAFVMKIGPLLVIEFGVTGNACYVFAASDFKANLDRAVLKTNSELKQHGALKRLSHSGSWEHKFDYELKKQLQSIPWSRGQLREHQVGQTSSTPVFSSTSRLQRVWPSTPDSSPFANLPAPEAVTSTPLPQRTETIGSASEQNQPLRHTSKGLGAQPNLPQINSLSATESAPQPPGRKDSTTGWLTSPQISSRKHSTARPRMSDLEFQQLQTLFKKNGIEWLDNRSKGGALWVLLGDRNVKPHVSSVLDLYRFQFKEGKGFWLKENE